MERALIVPAAGLGSRLGSSIPKLLVPLNGRPMIEHLFGLYSGAVERIALVVHPTALDAVRPVADRAPVPVDVLVQEQPTGMLDAILVPKLLVKQWQPRRVWVTWCDQVAITAATVARLVDVTKRPPEPIVALPTCVRREPYVHLARDPQDRIVRVLHRREGDPMPETGESDAGLFDLSLHAYADLLPDYAAAPQLGARTRERNFLPFIVEAARLGEVRTFPCVDELEAVGVNTREELAVVEEWLRRRSAVAATGEATEATEKFHHRGTE